MYSPVKSDMYYFVAYCSYRDMKIVILGDASVGKTSLIQRYLQGVFNEDKISVGFYLLHIK